MMKKSLCLTALMMLFCLSLIACGQGNSDVPKDEGASSQKDKISDDTLALPFKSDGASKHSEHDSSHEEPGCGLEPELPEPDCGGIVGATCGKGQFCDLLSCGATAGYCTDVPEVCTKEYNPVVTCDGSVHSNPCMAAKAGKSISHFLNDDTGTGTTPPSGGEPADPTDPTEPTDPEAKICGGIVGALCDADEYCDLLTCGATAGVCRDIPQICTDEYAPVEGCDGQTYGNACEAAAAGQTVKTPAGGSTSPSEPTEPEEKICGGILGALCDAGEFCELFSCGATAGVCRTQPTVCTEEYAPVRACDGSIHSNACYAAMAGKTVDGPVVIEEPPQLCGGFVGALCDEGYYCRYDSCGSTAGICVEKPEACIKIHDPVEGCDGITYGNSCEAAAAGQTVK